MPSLEKLDLRWNAGHFPSRFTAEARRANTFLFADYRSREDHPAARPPNSVAVAAVTRLFPLLVERRMPSRPTPGGVEESADS
ncbi:hypothetical protein [Streptomyces nodosus]|uniref:hypothetical protein n=1 Tax=Streptomyces nodosus TaxID=40318 RepID=UPI00380B3F58